MALSFAAVQQSSLWPIFSPAQPDLFNACSVCPLASLSVASPQAANQRRMASPVTIRANSQHSFEAARNEASVGRMGAAAALPSGHKRGVFPHISSPAMPRPFAFHLPPPFPPRLSSYAASSPGPNLSTQHRLKLATNKQLAAHTHSQLRQERNAASENLSPGPNRLPKPNVASLATCATGPTCPCSPVPLRPTRSTRSSRDCTRLSLGTADCCKVFN